MKVARGAVLATIGVAIVVGILQYHRVLDPTRAERDGFVMNLLVDRGSAKVPNDWYTADGANVTTGGGQVKIVAGSDGWALESRIVHLLANDCYRVEMTGVVTRGSAVLAANLAELSHFSAYPPFPGTLRRDSFVVATPDERVTFAVAATTGAHITLAGVRVQRLARRCKTPRTGRDIGSVLDRLARS
jgi:hypothetical protein